MKKLQAIVFYVLFYKRYRLLFILLCCSYTFISPSIPLEHKLEVWLFVSFLVSLFSSLFFGCFSEYLSEIIVKRYKIDYKINTLDRRSHSGDSWSDYEIILEKTSFKLLSVQYFGLTGEELIINRAIIVKYLWSY